MYPKALNLPSCAQEANVVYARIFNWLQKVNKQASDITIQIAPRGRYESKGAIQVESRVILTDGLAALFIAQVMPNGKLGLFDPEEISRSYPAKDLGLSCVHYGQVFTTKTDAILAALNHFLPDQAAKSIDSVKEEINLKDGRTLQVQIISVADTMQMFGPFFDFCTFSWGIKPAPSATV